MTKAEKAKRGRKNTPVESESLRNALLAFIRTLEPGLDGWFRKLNRQIWDEFGLSRVMASYYLGAFRSEGLLITNKPNGRFYRLPTPSEEVGSGVHPIAEQYTLFVTRRIEVLESALPEMKQRVTLMGPFIFF